MSTFQLIHADRKRKGCVGQSLRSASHGNVCVYPRDDVNTPHESTRLLGRGGRAAQFGCSRSSLVTRRNSAQVVLLCGECGTASTYDLSLPSYLPRPSSFLICLHFFVVFFYPPTSFFAPLYTPQFSPLFALAALSFPSLPSIYFFFILRRYNPLTSFLLVSLTWLTDCRPSVYLRRGRAATVNREK